MRALAVHPVSAEFLVHFIRAKVELLALAVCRTSPGHKDLAVRFKDFCIENHVAVWADALSKPYCPPSADAFAGHIRNFDYVHTTTLMDRFSILYIKLPY